MTFHPYQRAAWDKMFGVLSSPEGLTSFIRGKYADGVATTSSLNDYLRDPTWNTMNGLVDRMPHKYPFREQLASGRGLASENARLALRNIDGYFSAISAGRSAHAAIESEPDLDAVEGDQHSQRGAIVEQCREVIRNLSGEDGFAFVWLAENDPAFAEIVNVAQGEFPERTADATLAGEQTTGFADTIN